VLAAATLALSNSFAADQHLHMRVIQKVDQHVLLRLSLQVLGHLDLHLDEGRQHVLELFVHSP
jgi:hypothetical protein